MVLMECPPWDDRGTLLTSTTRSGVYAGHGHILIRAVSESAAKVTRNDQAKRCGVCLRHIGDRQARTFPGDVAGGQLGAKMWHMTDITTIAVAVVGGVTTLLTGVGGYWLSGRNDEARDKRALKREQIARGRKTAPTAYGSNVTSGSGGGLFG